MPLPLKLTRPLAFFDLETTGTNVVNDRIVEISIYRVNLDGSSDSMTRLVNPTIPIPPEVTAIHGIKDQDVASAPTFAQLAPALDTFLKNCDLAGYNSNKFDVPMLIEEFLRCNIQFDIKKRRLVDVQNIFHKMEPRTLKAAYKFYCGKNLLGPTKQKQIHVQLTRFYYLRSNVIRMLNTKIATAMFPNPSSMTFRRSTSFLITIIMPIWLGILGLIGREKKSLTSASTKTDPLKTFFNKNRSIMTG
jgi:DNA polymerase III epsilon subunit-like protein